MRDMIPKGTGNSRFLKSSIPEGVTWEQFITLWRSGKFPVDFAGLNKDGIQILGSAYSKGNVLPDIVCSALGISTTSEPKDAFLALKEKIESERNDILGKFIFGTYIGTSEYVLGEGYPEPSQNINLGRSPTFLMVWGEGSPVYFVAIGSGGDLGISFGFAHKNGASSRGVSISDDGFTVTNHGTIYAGLGDLLNIKNAKYSYFAYF